MLGMAINDINQFQVYNHSLAPITHYSKTHLDNSLLSEDDVKKLLPYAKQTDFILGTFSDIIDDLNYNKEKFEEIIFSLDDDYDTLKEFMKRLSPKLKIHNELYTTSDKILTHLIKVQNELGLVIQQNEYNTL